MTRSIETLAQQLSDVDGEQRIVIDTWKSMNRGAAAEITRALAEPIKAGEAEIEGHAATLRRQHRGDGLWIGGTNNWTDPFTMQAVIDVVQPEANDTLYDLGAGYNFPSLYAGMTTPAQCRGIELLPERARRGQETQAKLEEVGSLKPGQVACIEASAYDVDISDGTIFYMYNSFGGEGLARVLSKIDEAATDHQVTLVTRRVHHEHITDRVANLALIGAVEYRPSIEGVVYVFGSEP